MTATPEQSILAKDFLPGETIEGMEDEYAPEPGAEHPLRGYAALTGIFAAGAALVVAFANRRRRKIRVSDVALLGIATNVLARTITRDTSTSFVRAPFTRYVDDAGRGEVEEEPRGRGLRRAVGELVTCPWCAAPWIAATLTLAFAARPRETRVLAGLLSVIGIAGAVQVARGRLGDA